MRPHAGQLGSWAPWGCLAALGLCLAGLFPPFASLVCVFCPIGFGLDRYTGSLLGGADGPALLALVLAAVVATVLVVLRAPGGRLAAPASLLLSLAALALVVLDAVTCAQRVLDWSFYLPTTLEVGFYLALPGAAIASASATLMVANQGSWWASSEPERGRQAPASRRATKMW